MIFRDDTGKLSQIKVSRALDHNDEKWLFERDIIDL